MQKPLRFLTALFSRKYLPIYEILRNDIVEGKVPKQACRHLILQKANFNLKTEMKYFQII